MTLIGGMRGFVVLWFGQLISLLGTSMTRFALTIWAYQTTGSATALALVGFFSFGPSVLLSPVAGAIVDRWDRKKIMIATDLVISFDHRLEARLFAEMKHVRQQ